MKSKQKGEVVIAAAVAYLVAGFLVVVGPNTVSGAKAPEAPVYHNYNGGFTK